MVYGMSLFPIFADPNPPSNLTGLDVSLSAGRMTARDESSNRIEMNALDGLFQTSLVLPNNSTLSTVELQFNNDGNSTNSSLSSEQMFINATNRDVLHLTGSLAEISDENTVDQNRTTIRKDKVQVVNTAGGTKTAFLDAENVNMTNGADSVNMTATTLTANGVPASWVAIVDLVVNPPSPPVPTLQSVLDVGNTASGENAFIELRNGVASTQLTQTGLQGLSVDGNRTMSLTTPTVDVDSAVLSSSSDITLNATDNIRLTGDALFLSGSGMISSVVAGGSTNQYLVLNVNGTAYKISLLAVA